MKTSKRSVVVNLGKSVQVGRSAKTKGMLREPREKDAQLKAFETEDLGRQEGLQAVVIRPKGKVTSISLEPDLVQGLKIAGEKRGLGYQTMLKLIVRENIARYSEQGPPAVLKPTRRKRA